MPTRRIRTADPLAVAAVNLQVVVTGRLKPIPAALVERTVVGVLRRERRTACISVTFLGREAMRTLNRTHKGNDRPTDVLAFALPTPGGRLVGDIYISPWAAAAAARRWRVPLREELLRLVIHGTLHVLGYDHPEDASRMTSPMWRRQERLLVGLGAR